METKVKYNRQNMFHQKNYTTNNAFSTNSKSITTQTEESSFLNNLYQQEKLNFCGSNVMYEGENVKNRSHNFQTSNVNVSSENVPSCPVCNHNSLSANGFPLANPYSVPWYSPYGFPPLPPMSLSAPFLPLSSMPPVPPMFSHGVMPPQFSYSNQFNHQPNNYNIENRATNLRMNMRPDYYVNNTNPNFCNENINLKSSSLSANNFQNHLKTSCVRSEPNVTRNCCSNHNTVDSNLKNFEKCNLMNCDLSNMKYKTSKKNLNLMASDTSISCQPKLKSELSSTALDNSNCKANKKDIKCDKGDYNNILLQNYNHDLLKNPIYKYADIRIQELQTNLKDIKDNICKLSTKASELNINDTTIACESDECSSNFNKYFTTFYNSLKEKDSVSTNLNSINESLIKLSKLNRISSDSLLRNSNNSSCQLYHSSSGDILRDKPTSLNNNAQLFQEKPCSKSISELYKNNYELPCYTFTNDLVNTMKRTTPLHDIPSALKNNYQKDNLFNNNCKHKKSKSEQISLNKNNEKIMAEIISPKWSSLNNDLIDSKNNKHSLSANKNRSNNINKKFENISFNFNYSSPTDNDKNKTNHIEHSNLSENVISSDPSIDTIYHQNDNQIIKRHSNSLMCNTSNLNFNDSVDDDDINNNYDVELYEDIDDTSLHNIKSNSKNSTTEQISNNVQQNIDKIENWLEKNVESQHDNLNNSIQNNNNNNNNINQVNRRVSQLTNLEILSKISEEDEEKFSNISSDNSYINANSAKTYVKEKPNRANKNDVKKIWSDTKSDNDFFIGKVNCDIGEPIRAEKRISAWV